MSKSDTPHKGDKVTWNTPQGETKGTVEQVAKSPVKIKSNTIKADSDHPRVVVRSDKTGAKAAHKPDAVHKR